MFKLRDRLLPRFMSKIVKVDSGCWLWQGAVIKSTGYGRFGVCGGVVEYAHRAAWMFFKGPIPSEMFVCHTCDVRECVNPDHLFIGTAKDNMRDASRKGRCVLPTIEQRLRGEDQPMAKLSNAQVIEIRGSSETVRVLSKKYGVSIGAISQVKNFKTYRSVI